MGHKTRPGHANMQHQRMSCDGCLVCVSYSALFQNELLPPSSELVLHSCKFLMLPSGFTNVWHLHEWGTISEDGAFAM